MNETRRPTGSLTLVIALLALACAIAAIVIALRASSVAQESRDANPFIEGSEARQEAQRTANRLRSANNARVLAQAIIMYARQHDDEAPPQDDWRQILLDAQFISPDLLTFPGNADVDHAYHYIRPTPAEVRSMGEPGAGDIVLIYEDPDLWKGAGGHVAYVSTRTEWIEGDAFGALVEKLRAGE